MTYRVIINRASGLQEGLLMDTSGTYSIDQGDLVIWDERSNGTITENIDEIDVPIDDNTFFAHIGKMELVITPKLSIFFNETYIAGHFEALISNYHKEVQAWTIKFWLSTFNIVATLALDVVNTAIEATYATVPLNKILWMEKETLKWGGAIWQIIKDETGKTNSELHEIWETAEQTYYQNWPN